MGILKAEFKVRSSDNIHDLAGKIYYPKGNPNGFLHIVHGMTEHIARYDRFMTDMAEMGWLCFGYDNLGHGQTVNDDSELGYIAKKDGWDLLARDVKVYSDAVIANYIEKKGETLPYYLMGHSMGSFIVRIAAEKYVKPDKLIIMGTGGENKAADMGLALVGLMKKFKGEKHISPLLDKIAFGSYNDRFGGGTEEDPSPWLTSDIKVRKKYYADKYCTFKFTVSAMGDLIRLIKESNRAEWYKNISKEMPILLISGEEDPVGDYGKGVSSVYEKLKKEGCNVKCILYKNVRHEVLNDVTIEMAKCDIVVFCEEN